MNAETRLKLLVGDLIFGRTLMEIEIETLKEKLFRLEAQVQAEEEARAAQKVAAEKKATK